MWSPKNARGRKGPHANVAPVAFRAASGDLLGNYTPRLPCLRFLQTPRVPMQVIPFYIHLLHTQPDLLEKSQGTAEIKFRECLKKRGQSCLDISTPLSVCGLRPGLKQTGREWPSNVLMHSDARYSSGQPEADPRMSRDGVSEDSEASAGRMKRGPTRTHGERR